MDHPVENSTQQLKLRVTSRSKGMILLKSIPVYYLCRSSDDNSERTL